MRVLCNGITLTVASCTHYGSVECVHVEQEMLNVIYSRLRGLQYG